MGCVQPQSAWRLRRGDGITFTRSLGWADRPVAIACGRCLGCQKAKNAQWAIRVLHEAQCHEFNCFITLTIDDEHMPEDQSLDLRHWQLFAKRLRKNVGPFRFFMSGEYGDRTERPHYHACIFGMDFRLADAEPMENTSGKDLLWNSPQLDKLWGMGHVAIGALSYESAHYTAKYLQKRSVKDKGQNRDERGRLHEFISMSKNPGIGAEWIRRFKNETLNSQVITHEGKIHAVPKYYEGFFTDDELVKWRREKQKKIDHLIEIGEMSTARREVRELVLEIEKTKRDRRRIHCD